MENFGGLGWLDYVTIALFFAMIIGIGFWSQRSVKSSDDFYVGGGKIPWWLSGISHHVSGYSGVMFVGYAGIAYTYGTAIYFWWACNIGLGMAISSVLIAPRWPRLRRALGIQSPTEYLEVRYNTAAQLLVAICGIVSKLIDVAAKWASLGILLHGFTGLPIWLGIIVGSCASMLYITIGGILADLLTDCAQFAVTFIAGMLIFISVLLHLQDYGLNLITAFEALPAGHLRVFNEGNGQGAFTWTVAYFLTQFLNYSGGVWNLAARFISTPEDKEAKKAAMLSSIMYFIWPLILFIPMWLGPIIFPGMTQSQAENTLYASLAKTFLPTGLVGLVLAAMFAQTMSMCNSDVNTVSAVITRDILPKFKESLKKLGDSESLRLARATTILFTAATVIIALFNEQFGGITGMILTWFSAMTGPTAIPLICGLLPPFKHCDAKAAILSALGGLAAFAATKMGLDLGTDVELALPLVTSFVIFCAVGMMNHYVLKQPVPASTENLMEKLGED